MIFYFCGTCGAAYRAIVYDRQSKTIRAEPVCLKEHPLCIQIGTEKEAREKQEAYYSVARRNRV